MSRPCRDSANKIGFWIVPGCRFARKLTRPLNTSAFLDTDSEIAANFCIAHSGGRRQRTHKMASSLSSSVAKR